MDIPEHKLQIWPGYKTTINQYEDRLLMVTEIAHKVISFNTIFGHLINFIFYLFITPNLCVILGPPYGHSAADVD